MACLEASCSCGWLGFGNDSFKIAKCPECGRLTYLSHDEFGSFQNPLEYSNEVAILKGVDLHER